MLGLCNEVVLELFGATILGHLWGYIGAMVYSSHLQLARKMFTSPHRAGFKVEAQIFSMV